MKNDHIPVLLTEVIQAVDIKPGHQYVDATLGQAGYTIEVLKRGGNVLAIEQDRKMLKLAENNLADACPDPQPSSWGSFKLVHGNFKDILKIAQNNGIHEVSGVLYDLGVSTQQLTSLKRGFSFQEPDADLDMRMDKNTQKVKAYDLLNALRQDQLMNLFGRTMDYKKAKSLTEQVIRLRKDKSFKTVGQFLELFNNKSTDRIHPATQAFLALRMAVNSEIENIERSLPKALDLLKKGGRIAVVSFHSTEDRVVKNSFNEFEKAGIAKKVNKKPISPSAKEIENNPSARSAKLRAIEKT